MAKQRTDTESVLRLVIDGKQAKASGKELGDTFRKLSAELNNMKESDNPELYRKKAAELKKVREAWDAVRREVNGTTKSIKESSEAVSSLKSQMADLAKQAVTGMGITGVVYGVVNGVKTMVSKNAELSDSYGRVMKTTGLTEEAVDRLNTKFKKMDTRTANAELLGLAEVAGKLGISAEKDVEGFVRAADKIGVALGEDLGGIEESINSLGKLTDIFKVKDQFGLEQSLLKVGSAINTLGASGTAAEKNLVDFANRLAGVAPAAGITIDQVLGLAAVQDELGQSMESSSTAIGQFIVHMGADVPKYAKIAGMSVREFSKLLKTDANEAFLRVLESSKSSSGGVELLAKNMGLIEVSGNRGVAALGAMADNIDLVRQRQQEAKQAFDEGTSVLDEFNTMNTNLAANLDKLGNRIDNLWQHSGFRNWLTDITGAMLDTRSSAQRLSDELEGQRKKNEDLEKSLIPLLGNYDELKNKGSLTRIEQEKLRTIIQQIAALMPEAVTEWNAYGEALDINRVKVEQMTFAQKELFLLRNKDTVKDLQDVFTANKVWSDLYLKEANAFQEKVRTKENEGFLSWFGIDRKGLWKRDVAEFTERSKLAMGEAYDAAIKLRNLGVELTQPMKDVIYSMESRSLEFRDVSLPAEKTGEDTAGGTSLTKEQEKAAERARKAAEKQVEQASELFKKLTDQTAEFGQTQLMELLSKNEKEVEQEKAKYQKLIQEWEEYKAKRAAALGTNDEEKLSKDADYVTAIGQIALLEVQQDEAVQAMRVKHREEADRKIEELRTNLANKQASELQKERDRINKFYSDLEKDNAGNEEVLAQLKMDREKDLSDALIREKERIKEETKRIEGETIDLEGDRYANRMARIQSAYAAELLALETKYGNELAKEEEFLQAKAALEAKYGVQRKQVELDREREIREAKYAIAQSTADAVFSIMQNNRDAELSDVLSKLDKQRQSELANANLTEAQKSAINDRYDRKIRSEKLRAWKADKQAAILQGIINTALAVTKALPNPIAAAVAGAAGAAQVAVITAQKPPQFARGGFVPVGPTHAQGGIDLVDRRNRIIGNIEGGEPILSRATYANNRDIVDALIYSGQRRNGARIGLNPDLIDAERMVRNGGVQMAPPASVTVPSPTLDVDGLVRAIDGMVDRKIRNIQVELPYTVLEERQNKVVQIRDSVNV